jgi:hypothetical protein
MPGIQLEREVGHGWLPVEPRRDDDVIGLEPAVARIHDVAVSGLGETIDGDAAANRKLEALRVGLEVVGELDTRGI